MSRVLAAVCLALLAACRAEAPPPAGPPAPDADRVRRDLVGATFVFYEDAEGPREWTVAEDELRAFQLVDTLRAGADRLLARADVTLAAPLRTIRGRVQLDYRLVGGQWALGGVSRSGPNFDAGDAEVVLFDASVARGDSAAADGFAFDVVARYRDGRYLAPFDSVRTRIRALLDSTYATDSLRARATDGVAAEVGRAWVRAGQTLRLLVAGTPPRAVTVDSVAVSVDGCEYLTAWGRGRDGDAGLATSSSILGGARAPGRALTGAEVRAAERAARDLLDRQGLDARRLRDAGAVAADLDGDGSEEALAVYTVGGAERDGEGAGAVAVAVRPRRPDAPVAFWRAPATAQGFTGLALVGVLDVDGDGAAEVVLREEGWEVYRYRVVTFRDGRFADAFRGGGGGC